MRADVATLQIGVDVVKELKTPGLVESSRPALSETTRSSSKAEYISIAESSFDGLVGKHRSSGTNKRGSVEECFRLHIRRPERGEVVPGCY